MTAWPDRPRLARYLAEAVARGDAATARNTAGALAMLDELMGAAGEAAERGGVSAASRPLTWRRLLTPCLPGPRHDKAATKAAS